MDIVDKISNFSKKKDTFIKSCLNILIALPALFLLVNNYPYLMVLSILLILLPQIEHVGSMSNNSRFNDKEKQRGSLKEIPTIS